MDKRRRLALAALLAAASFASAAGGPGPDERLIASFPDNADLRSRIFSSLIGAPREIALSYGEKILQSSSGTVLARAVKRSDDFLVEFRNGSGGLFDATTRGSCVVQRSNPKGFITQARIYLQDDLGSYLRLYLHPSNGGTLADVVMYGALLKQGIKLEGMIQQVLVKPFPKIVDSTRGAFDWGLVFPAARPTAGDAAGALALSALLEGSNSLEDFAASDAARGAEELSSPAALPAGFYAERAEVGGKSTLQAFPRYAAGRGLAPAALPAALYLDALERPGASYALFGEGIRALVMPRLEDTGRFVLISYRGGREASFEELLGAARQALRVLRLPPSGP